jgi:Zn-dependent protease with chaperone function
MKHLRTTPLALLMLCAAAQAHEGHGLPGSSHWHATDTLLVLAAVAVAVAAAGLWWSRRK